MEIDNQQKRYRMYEKLLIIILAIGLKSVPKIVNFLILLLITFALIVFTFLGVALVCSEIHIQNVVNIIKAFNF